MSPRTTDWPRVFVSVGMIAILPLAVMFLLLGLLVSGGVLENQTPEQEAAGGALVVASAFVGCGALVFLAGLLGRRHVLMALGGFAVAAAAALLALDWMLSDWKLGEGDGDFITGLFAVAAIGVAAVWLALRPPRRIS